MIFHEESNLMRTKLYSQVFEFIITYIYILIYESCYDKLVKKLECWKMQLIECKFI